MTKAICYPWLKELLKDKKGEREAGREGTSEGKRDRQRGDTYFISLRFPLNGHSRPSWPEA